MTQPGRYAFLDLYRGIIILLMIEGHVARELLEPLIRDTAAFSLHEFFHGITGPGFLFGAGITFGIAAQRRWVQYLSFTPTFWKRLRRIALLLALGYMLHLPFFSLKKTLEETSPEGWISFAAFDVLQCIGTSLLILQILLFVIRQERFFPISILALMMGVVYATPVLWTSDWVSQLPLTLSMAFQGTTGSSYPIFPNAGFLFAGGFISYEFMKFAELRREADFVKRLAILGVLLHVAGLGLEQVPITVYGDIDYWRTSPNFFLIKLGGLFLLMSGVWYLEHRAFATPFSTKARWLVLLGIESLTIYIVHLLLLYGWILNPETSLSRLWADSLSWPSVLAVTVLFTALLALLAWGWNTLKTRHPVLLRGISWWMGVVFFYEFLTRPY